MTLTRTHFTAAFLIGAVVVAGWRASTTGLITEVAKPTTPIVVPPEPPLPPQPVPIPPTPVKPANPSSIERVNGGVVVRFGDGE